MVSNIGMVERKSSSTTPDDQGTFWQIRPLKNVLYSVSFFEVFFAHL